MANLGTLAALQAAIDAAITANGVNGITGPILNTILTDMADTLTGFQVVPKVWEGYITQAGVAAPTVVEITNTLGGTPVFSYLSGGEYAATLVGAFPPTKTSWYIGPQSVDNLIVGGGVIQITPESGDTLFIRSFDISSGVGDDGALSSTYFKITVSA